MIQIRIRRLNLSMYLLYLCGRKQKQANMEGIVVIAKHFKYKDTTACNISLQEDKL